MNPERAFEIIDACGADSARWPGDERAALQALAARDPKVAAALVAAGRLDALLAGWAHDAAPAEFDVAAITRLPQEGAAPARKGPLPLRWITGGALAAAVATGLIILAPMQRVPAPEAETAIASLSPQPTAPSAAAIGKGGGNEAEAFANVFTPTPDEEELI